jgi:peptidoglycan-associated lipoprotein
MVQRYLIPGTILVCMLFVLTSGCARKPIKPPDPATFGGGGTAAPYGPGAVSEQELQVLQANLRAVYFDYDHYNLSPQAQSDLQYNAEVLKRARYRAIVAEGHCDERGTAEYNLALGDRRARSVVDYLLSLGVDPGRLTTVSYGSELPVDPGHDESAWSKNRRVYLRVSQ